MLSFNPPHAFLEANGKKIGLDAGEEIVFVSHAHFDHAPSLKKARQVIATPQTIELLEARGKRLNTKHSTEFNEFNEFCGSENGFKTRLLNSGHVLGGAMLYAEWDSRTVLYSSDFKTRDSLTQKGARPLATETLVMESTYGLPEFVFPPRESVYNEIVQWTRKQLVEGKCVILGGYALGKAQELIACLNKYADITPIASEEIARVNDVYARHGIALDFLRVDSEEGARELKKNFVAVLPTRFANKQVVSRLQGFYGRRVVVGVASGMCLMGWRGAGDVDKAFVLSDHADFLELCDFVEQCAPKRVFCLHGYAQEFARVLRARGFKASAVEEVETITQ